MLNSNIHECEPIYFRSNTCQNNPFNKTLWTLYIVNPTVEIEYLYKLCKFIVDTSVVFKKLYYTLN